MQTQQMSSAETDPVMPSDPLAPRIPGTAITDPRSERRSTLREPIRALMQSEDYEATLAALAGIALPDVGAWSIVDIVESSGALRRLAVVHSDVAKQELARALQDGWPPAKEDPLGVPVVMRTRQPQIIPVVNDEMLVEVSRNGANLKILRELGIGSLLTVPLIGNDEILGAITFVTPVAGHPYSERDLARAEELAALCALVVHHERLRRESERARKQADDTAAETLRQKRDLEQIMETQARLVRGFSHDVKNPLGAAQGYAHLLESGVMSSLTPEQHNSIVRIRTSIGSALQLIDDLVEYARNKTGRLDIRLEPVAVGELARELADEYRAQIESKGLELVVETAPRLPEVWSDRIRIRQILGNLLSNAVKFTEIGHITIGVRLGRAEVAPGPGRWIALSVADSGPGIAPEDHAMVFQEFARLEPATTQGTGLGLAISEWIADALGATITLESRRGWGATFTVWLPVAQE